LHYKTTFFPFLKNLPKNGRGWPHLGGDGMHSKNYQPDSFHRLVLHGVLYTFFADEYVITYAVKSKS